MEDKSEELKELEQQYPEIEFTPDGEEEVVEEEVVVEEPETPIPLTTTTPPPVPTLQPRPSFSFSNFAQSIIPKPRRKNELADLFETPGANDNDIYADDLIEYNEDDADPDVGDLLDDDLSDLVSVSREDVMGRAPRPRKSKTRRIDRPYDNPMSMGGMR